MRATRAHDARQGYVQFLPRRPAPVACSDVCCCFSRVIPVRLDGQKGLYHASVLGGLVYLLFLLDSSLNSLAINIPLFID